jgi:hypothetical protein
LAERCIGGARPKKSDECMLRAAAPQFKAKWMD